MSQESPGTPPLTRRAALRLLGAGAAAGVALRAARATAAALERRIPSSGEMIPALGIGTWRVFDVGASAADRAPIKEVLRRFVELGGRAIDSSPMYGAAEDVVGDVGSELGVLDRLFLATKVWTSGRQAGIAQMEQSFRRMRTRRMDLMRHNLPDCNASAHAARVEARRPRPLRGGDHHSQRLRRAGRGAARPRSISQVNYPW
jgi:hypothetical protein